MRGLWLHLVVVGMTVLVIRVSPTSAGEVEDLNDYIFRSKRSGNAETNATIQGRMYNRAICRRRPTVYRVSGTFSSPGYDGEKHYPADVECTYKLKAKRGMVVKIVVTAFDLEDSPNCLNDRFSVIYGNDRRADTALFFCGTRPSFAFTTCTQTAFVIFVSDDSTTGRGFQANFESVPGTGGSCRAGLTTPSPTTSTSAPSTSTPTPTTRTSTPSTATPSPTTATPSRTTATPSPTTVTPFPTTPPPTTPAPDPETCPGTTVDLKGPSGTFQSPSYPGYPNNADCTWLITVDPGHVILVQFPSFVLQRHKNCLRDYLTLYDGPSAQSTKLAQFCAKNSKDVTSSGNQMYIHFHSNADRPRRGFKAQYSAKKATTTKPRKVFSITTDNDKKASTCYKPEVKPTGDFIVGGRPANAHSYPWVVSIFHDHPTYGKIPYCGGSILSETEVLTAAHCVVYLAGSSWSDQSSHPERYEVRVGVHKLYDNTNTQRTIHKVTKIILHEKFVPSTFENDLAIMTVEPRIKYRREALPLCLGEKLEVGKSCTIAGWGEKLGTEAQNAGPVLYEVGVNIMADDICKSPEYLGGTVRPGMFCAGHDQGGKDSCQGDSGGPLFCKESDGLYRMMGVISWGIGCAAAKKPGVYADVPHFAEWIRANMA